MPMLSQVDPAFRMFINCGTDEMDQGTTSANDTLFKLFLYASFLFLTTVLQPSGSELAPSAALCAHFMLCLHSFDA